MNRRKFLATGLGVAATATMSAAQQAGAGRQSSERAGRSANIAIIGAGLFGSAAARYLSNEIDGVVLIGPEEPEDRRTHQGVFASHYDASRLVRGIDPDRLWATLAKHSIERYRSIEDQSGVNFYHNIGYMMVTPGGLGEDWFNLPAMREVASELNVEIEDLDDASLRERFPWLRFTPGSSAVLQGQGAGYIDPRRLVQAQQTISVAQGTTLLRDVAVDLRRKGEQVEIELRSGETVHANRVLVATGAYTNANGLLPRKLEFKIRAAMIMESEVAPETHADYPTTFVCQDRRRGRFLGAVDAANHLCRRPVIHQDDGRLLRPCPVGRIRGARQLESQQRARRSSFRLAASIARNVPVSRCIVHPVQALPDLRYGISLPVYRYGRRSHRHGRCGQRQIG
jgi:glycine/D-amino acid oxidase-like deaminating enzyme